MSAFFMEDLYEDFIKISFRSKDDVDTNAFAEHISTVVDISMLLVVNILKISTKRLKILNRRLRMKIFKQFFSKVKRIFTTMV